MRVHKQRPTMSHNYGSIVALHLSLPNKTKMNIYHYACMYVMSGIHIVST